MKLFHHRKQVLPLPPGCTPADIATSSSVCTGETLIGFRLSSGELAGAVLCRNE